MAEIWKKCTECRIDIVFGATYYQCSVSTCNRTRMPLVFCSVICWDSHLSTVRHRDAGAIEAKAPSKSQWEQELAGETASPAPARPASTPDSVQPVHRRSDETRPNLIPPPPAAATERRVVVATPAPAPAAAAGDLALSDAVDKDVLVVVSKLKKYIKDRSGFNTSDQIFDLISDHVRAICDEAIRCAARNDRKTVLERDMPRPPRR
ncbi:MAG: hypothetical protein M4D80_30440 [Myxococcota bacterium]|nr:hypothetical protein [Deltaproteobacteria bacterium]MDQ3339505.1 hypothetical protein [Myxococcota bacterium]